MLITHLSQKIHTTCLNEYYLLSFKVEYLSSHTLITHLLEKNVTCNNYSLDQRSSLLNVQKTCLHYFNYFKSYSERLSSIQFKAFCGKQKIWAKWCFINHSAVHTLQFFYFLIQVPWYICFCTY